VLRDEPFPDTYFDFPLSEAGTGAKTRVLMSNE